jgi:hypothetical protein
MSSITVEQYSEKAIVVRGNTVPYKEKLLSIGGKWNKMLKGGEGWIFPLTKKPVVEKILSEAPSVHQNDISENDNNSSCSKQQRTYNYKTNRNNISDDSEVVLTKKEYLHLISRLERLEQMSDIGNNTNKEKRKNTTNKNIPPPLSSINDSDINELDYDIDEPERDSIQPLLKRKKV